MSKVFKVWPKRVKRTNGTVLTPEMVVIVTTKNHVRLTVILILTKNSVALQNHNKKSKTK